MQPHRGRSDIAGEAYWSKEWQSGFDWRSQDERIGGWQNRVAVCFDEFLVRHINRPATRPLVVLEVGCARSRWLPYFARRFDAEIKGLDYSSIGCEQTQEILRRTGYEGEIVHADLFDPPPQLIGLADVVFSWGLVEHFTDTAAVAAALHRLARPGGRVITVVPNMAAAAGRLQRWINREIYDLHVPLDRGHLLSAFESVAAKVEFCDYFMPVNFWVVNPGPTADRRLGRLKAMVYACAKLITVGAWQLETRFRTRLPSSRTFSPYIVCVSLEATAR